MFPPDSTTHGRKDRAHGRLLTPSELGGTALATRRHSNFRAPEVKISWPSPGVEQVTTFRSKKINQHFLKKVRVSSDEKCFEIFSRKIIKIVKIGKSQTFYHRYLSIIFPSRKNVLHRLFSPMSPNLKLG